MSHWYFRDVLPVLADGREVIAIDLPGFGESDRPHPMQFAYDGAAFAVAVAEVLRTLGVERATVFGHSMGGGAALALAAREPELVERLAVCSPSIYPLPVPVEGKLLFQLGLGSLLWRKLVTRGEMRRLMLRDHFRDPRPVTDEFVDYYWARLNRPGGHEASYAALVNLARLGETPSEPALVKAPTLILWPDEDRVVPLASGKRLARAMSNARLQVVPACGHNTHLERPDEFLRQLLPFLNEQRESKVGAIESQRNLMSGKS